MKPICFLLLSVLLAVSMSASTDKELARLDSALQAARSQIDMNLRSTELAQYLDRKLMMVEEEIKKNLDSESLALFLAASQRWRDYRTAEIKSEGDVYRDGSLRPLVENMVFARLTKERLIALQDWDPEGKYKDK